MRPEADSEPATPPYVNNPSRVLEEKKKKEDAQNNDTSNYLLVTMIGGGVIPEVDARDDTASNSMSSSAVVPSEPLKMKTRTQQLFSSVSSVQLPPTSDASNIGDLSAMSDDPNSANSRNENFILTSGAASLAIMEEIRLLRTQVTNLTARVSDSERLLVTRAALAGGGRGEAEAEVPPACGA